MADYSIVGTSVDRRDAVQKVTGRALHTGNLEPPGLLHVAVLRSPHPHARIVRIDKSGAEASPGVAAVLTGADIAAMPGITPYHGPAFADQPVLAIDRVRHEGEQVVAVAAESRRAAEAALERVEVEYEPLPVVLDVLDAIKPDAPIIHEEVRPSGAFADLAHVKAGERSNICYHYKLRKGDVERAFAEADRVFEDVFTAPPAQHVPMEAHVSLAYVDEGGRINIYTASQSPSFVRGELARMLGVPMNRIRVRVPYLGGGYGAKLYNKLEPLVTLLAMKTAAASEVQPEPRGGVPDRHQARCRGEDQDRGQGLGHDRAQVRGLLGHRRLCRDRAADRPQVGIHFRRAIQDPQRVHRLLLHLHQQAAGRAVPRLRGAAGDLGLRLPDGHHRPGTRRRSGGVPPGARAGGGGSLRHRNAGPCLRPQGVGAAGGGGRGMGSIQGARLGHQAPRQGYRLRGEGRAHALHIGCHRHPQCRRQRQHPEQHGGDGPGLGERAGPDRGRGIGDFPRQGARGAAGYRRHALRHHQRGKPLHLPHGQRGPYGRGQGQGGAVRGRGREAGDRPCRPGGGRRAGVRARPPRSGA